MNGTNLVKATEFTMFKDCESFTCPYKVGNEVLTIVGIAYLDHTGKKTAEVSQIFKDGRFMLDFIMQSGIFDRYQRAANLHAQSLFSLNTEPVDVEPGSFEDQHRAYIVFQKENGNENYKNAI